MFDLIVAGVKTVTVRLNGGAYAEGLRLTDGRRSVEARRVEQRTVKLGEASDYYTVEGFRSRREFRNYLTRLYPGLGLDDEVMLIRFTLKS
jgi:hypothetical protein